MNIILICAQGVSTGILSESIIQNLYEDEQDWIIEAKSFPEARDIVGKYDLILLAPQMSFHKETLVKLIEPYDTQIYEIAPQDFAMLRGKKILEYIRKNYIPQRER